MYSPYGVDPWLIREDEFNPEALGRTESLFTLSNGHIGARGNLDEGEPHGVPGTYLNSVYELRPLPYAEAGFGYPESGQTLINVTNGKLFRLLVNDEPFDVRYGSLTEHTRTLDLRSGTLSRSVEWCSPAGDHVRVRSERLVSLTQRGVMAISYEVEPIDTPLRVVVQSELLANEDLPPERRDPRVAAALEHPLVSEEHVATSTGALLVHSTKHSGLRVAAGMRHTVDGPEGTIVESEAQPDIGRVTVATPLKPGEKLRIVKFVAYGWSSVRSRPAVHDQVIAALAAAHRSGWDALRAEQRRYLDDFWDGADVEIEGDAEIQQAVRLALFHVLQAGARAEQRPIPSKGLTGPGYDGHVFWDQEMFVLPVLLYTHPETVADVLRWRHATLPLAQERAEVLGLKGAAFPWRTIAGQECSGYWPAGTAAFHVNAAVADATVRYIDATEDWEFEESVGVELLVETARLWRSLGHHDASGQFRIDGVTGPDEYTAIVDNNVYTNLMAQMNLRAAADATERHRHVAEQLGVTTEESASWRDAAASMYIPYDERLRVHPQNDEFTDHAVWDFASMTPHDYPLFLHHPYFDLYRKQVVKQSDLVLAMQIRPEAFTDEQKERNFAYYEALCVRDSSLSACTQAVMAAETGHIELAYDYLGEASLVDLHDLAANSRDGLHMASMAGSWSATVAGLGGMRIYDGMLHFKPRLPSGITRLRFRMRYRGRTLRVQVTADTAEYQILSGDEIVIIHYGEKLHLGSEPVTRAIPPLTPRRRPHQPAGRAPTSRGDSVRLGSGSQGDFSGGDGDNIA